jgi:membrane-associated protease RseP (regulator of RpoE activity)
LKEKIQFDGLLARKMGAHELRAQTKLTFAILGSLGRSLFSFDQQQIGDSVNRLSGPVGIVKFGETVLDDGGRLLYLAFGGMISLALAIFNVLPIPALDGGRALGVVVQTVGRFKPENYFVIENYLNIFFFGLLMLLGVYIILLDLVRFWDVSIPFIG